MAVMNSTYIYTALPSALPDSHSILRLFNASPTARYATTSLLAFAVICLLNWIWTYSQRTQPSAGGGPPVIPHWIPWLGNAVSFVRDFDKFDAWARSVMPANAPYTLVMGGQKIYYINSPHVYEKAVQKSKQLSFDPLERLIVCRLFGLPEVDMDRYELGMRLGRPYKLPPGGMTPEEIEEAHMHKHFSKQYTDNFFGDCFVLMGDMIVKGYAEALDKHLPKSKDNEWITLDLVEFHKEVMFNSAVDVMFGCWREASGRGAELWKDFWAYEGGVMGMFYEYPKFLLRKTLTARRRLLDATIAWLHKCEKEALDVSDDLIWDEHWGSRVQRQRDRTTRTGGLSYEARAAHAFALLFALSANTIPAVIWMIYFAATTPNLLDRLREEIDAANLVTMRNGETGLPEVEASRLASLPLLSSAYKETLRMIVASMTTREVTEDVELAGYTLKKGTMVLMPSRPLHVNPYNWSSSDGAEPHPTTEFWAERFIEANMTAKEKRMKTSAWRPFGGGASYCVGRQIAGAEVMGTLAVFIAMFDIEVLSKPKDVKIDQSNMGRGGMMPSGKVMMRIRRRNH